MAEREHDRIIAAAAKSALGPLGFKRKGRSRLWYADRGYWLSVVEFQPSGFSQGSYLNVSAFWLWSPHNHISFDHMLQEVRSYISFKNAEQFRPDAERQAADAASASRRLRSMHPDLQSIRDYLVQDENRTAQGRGGVWQSYNAAIASGLLGDLTKTRSMLAATRERLAGWRPDLLPLVDELEVGADDKSTFSTLIHARIDARRAKFGLPPLAASAAEST